MLYMIIVVGKLTYESVSVPAARGSLVRVFSAAFRRGAAGRTRPPE